MSKYFELLESILKFNCEKSLILEIEFDDIFVEKPFDRKVDLSGINGMILEVREDEGPFIPHFHLFTKDARNGSDKKSKKSIHTCIQLNEAVYFDHPGKEDTLNNTQLKELDTFLRKRHKNFPQYTSLWEAMSDYWNSLPNSKTKVDFDKMPDYTNVIRRKQK